MDFLKMLKMDFKRLFYSGRLYFAVFTVSILTFLSIYPEIKASNYTTSIYYLVSVRGGIGAFLMAFATVIVLPYGLSYWEDIRNNYFNCLVTRVKLKTYSWSHTITTAVSAFLVIFGGYTICFGLLAFRLPVIHTIELENLQLMLANGGINAYDALMCTGSPILYFTSTFATEALGYAFMAVFAFALSAKINNVFVLLSLPIMLYYGSIFVCNVTNMPGIVRWYYIMAHGGLLANSFQDVRRLMLYIFLYFSALIFGGGYLFSVWIKKGCK